ncbi:MAG: hypothetical protein V1792_01220 [Pseudomonadota bacterium]
MGLINAVWEWIIIVVGEYAAGFLGFLGFLALIALIFYTGELLLFCFVRGYRIRKNPLTAEPMPEHKWLSENSFFIGLLFWVLLLILPYILL